MPKWRMNQAITEAIADEMASDDRVLLLGEDVAEAGGVFKTSAGLLERFGPARVRDTPIAEMGFTGLAVGVAAMGYRPVVEIMFGEFTGVALDQITTQAAKLRFLSRGQFTIPMVVRMSIGPGLGFGAQHSQTLERWFTNTPGLKVVMPSGADSAYGLLRAAIRDEDTVVFLEPRALYGEREDVDTDQTWTLGRARTRRSGSDVTIVTSGQMVAPVLAAAEAGIDADVIDLGSILPWDQEAVLESVRRTGRLVTVEANPYTGGWGTDIIAEVTAQAIGDLKAPPVRIAAPDVPVPYAASLERAYVPSEDVIRDQVQQLIATNSRPQAWWEGVPA